MTVYSYKWHEIDKYMTVPIYKELCKHQKKFPPYYQIICSYFGVGTFKEEEKKNKGKVNLGLIAMMKGSSQGEAPQAREI